jgi:epoxyqueuosine reductase QueG
VNSFSDQIKQKASEIGFHKIGIVRAESLTEEGENLKQWLAEN